jgi:hypothetical protein
MERERDDQSEPNPTPLGAAGEKCFVFDIVDVVEIRNSGRALHRLI